MVARFHKRVYGYMDVMGWDRNWSFRGIFRGVTTTLHHSDRGCTNLWKLGTVS